MILSIEGSRASGKSYLIKHLQTVLPSDVIYLPSKDEAAWIERNSPRIPKEFEEARKAEDWFIEIIAQRFKKAENNPKNLFNRDYLSLLSFSYALSKTFGINTFQELFKIYEKKLADGTFKKPYMRIILDNNYRLFESRATAQPKYRQDIWFYRDFANNLFDYYRLFGNEIEKEESVIIKPNTPAEHVAKIAIQYIL